MVKEDSHKKANLYGAYYFAHCCGRPYERSREWLNFFGSIADHIVRKICPRTVLDVGCGMGFLVEALRDRGVEAYGLDISEYAIAQVREDIRPYCWVASIVEELPQCYDLIVCIEVLEHIDPCEVERAIANICAHTEDILFSSTPFDYREPTHVNVQPPEYWAELFARHSFYRDVDFDASFITPWAMRLRWQKEPVHRLVRQYERKYWALWKECVDLRAALLEAHNQLAKQEQEIQQLHQRLGKRVCPDIGIQSWRGVWRKFFQRLRKFRK